MKVIYTYQLEIINRQVIQMPQDAKILTLQIQDGIPTIWAKVNIYHDMENRYIECFGTGQEIHEDMGIQREYFGTVQIGGLVWHFFERLD